MMVARRTVLASLKTHEGRRASASSSQVEPVGEGVQPDHYIRLDLLDTLD